MPMDTCNSFFIPFITLLIFSFLWYRASPGQCWVGPVIIRALIMFFISEGILLTIYHNSWNFRILYIFNLIWGDFQGQNWRSFMKGAFECESARARSLLLSLGNLVVSFQWSWLYASIWNSFLHSYLPSFLILCLILFSLASFLSCSQSIPLLLHPFDVIFIKAWNVLKTAFAVIIPGILSSI